MCYHSPDFSTLNCTLISKRDIADRDLYDWRKTGEQILSVDLLSKPIYGIGPSFPNRRQPWNQPPAGPTVRVEEYWEITRGYDVLTLMRQNMLTVEEEWHCPGPYSCRPDDTRKRTVTCLSDWVATDQTRKGMTWTRGVLKQLP